MTNRRRLGALFWLLTVQFFIAQAVAQSAMNEYDLIRFDISLLGITECGIFYDATSGSDSLICAPLHAVFNFGIIAHGILAICGLLLAQDLWQASRKTRLAAWCLIFGNIGAIIVGFFPLNEALGPHILGAVLALTLPGLGLILFGSAWRNHHPYFALFSIILGATILAGAILHAFGGPVLGRGTVERLAAWPQTIWYMVIGTAMLIENKKKRPALGQTG